ncbi:MAG TPA: hypothetical protein VFX92_00865 [Candidatus Krumholzibacteria bacterium]|nr:hypothetical protein [Candidatus Krumholzibacteria bacterium]
MPAYGWVGLASMLVFQITLFLAPRSIVSEFFTPLQWTGLILCLDGWRRQRRGSSLITDHFPEFLLLCLISIGSWMVFEGYNVLLRNWQYLNLPENPWIRFSGYAWAFATISPGMFLIYETLSDLLPGEDNPTYPQLPDRIFWPFVVFGGACMVVPFVWPSTHMTPLVWMGFAFFLDPLNGRLGERSILAEFFTGRFRSMPLFFLAGLVAGLLWEFWNYWAATKWQYDVPYLGHIKIFEMPVLGFLGFMPFIIESYAIYRFIRRLIPIRDEARYLG